MCCIVCILTIFYLIYLYIFLFYLKLYFNLMKLICFELYISVSGIILYAQISNSYSYYLNLYFKQKI